MAIRCRFVDSISATPTVRLDLNAGDTGSGLWLGKGGLRCPPPALRRAEADSMLWDGGTVSASSYGNRDLGVPISFRPGTMDLRNGAISALVKELNRETNILEYRPDGSSTSYFFRTFRSPDFNPTLWLPKNAIGMIDVDLYAEPFAYGLRVDQAGVSVKANPALANGCYLDANGVTGDVETPALVTLSGASASGTNGSVYLSVRRRGTPANLVFVYQAESAATLDSVTTVAAANDPLASGAGNNTTITTFGALTGLQTRVIWRLTEQVEMRGTYRALVRCKKTVSGDVVTISLADTVTGSVGAATTVTSTSYLWYDLGLVNFPHGTDSPNGYSGTYLNLSTGAVSGYSRLALAAGRSSGTGNFVADVALLLPADAELSVSTSTQPMSAASGAAWILDGPNGTTYNVATTDNSMTGFSPAYVGSFPKLQPGNNRLFLLDTYSSGVITDSMTVAVSFWPRFLSV